MTKREMLLAYATQAWQEYCRTGNMLAMEAAYNFWDQAEEAKQNDLHVRPGDDTRKVEKEVAGQALYQLRPMREPGL